MADGHVAETLRSAEALTAPHRHAHLPGEHPALDRLGIGVSITCAIHCVASAALGIVPALAGRFELLETMELPLLVAALIIGTMSLVPAARAHHHRGPLSLFAVGMLILIASRFAPEGAAELALTVSGFTPVALAHLWNLRLCHS